MTRSGRLFAAAAAMALALGLLPAGAAKRAGAPVAAPIPIQGKTIDLGDVPSAAEYRTDAPDGPGFVGSEAAVLGRSLARINKALGTDLRPDGRLARLARWVYDRMGRDASGMPGQEAFDVVTHRLGLPEPLPHLLSTGAPDAPRLANVVSSRLAKLFDIAEYTHIGGVAEREEGGVVVVIALSRRPFQLTPVARRLDGPGAIKLEGRLDGGFAKPELAHTLPGGETRLEPLGPGPDFSRTVDLTQPGRHRLELAATGPAGPEILANFPVFVGVPVDETAADTAPPQRPVKPDAVQGRLLELINADRAKAGLDPLVLDPELSDVARRHSEDMRDNDFAGHVSPTAGTTEERLARAGIVTSLAAENVAKGYAPDEIHKGLMDSPGHRAAIILPAATHLGLGVAPKKEGGRTTYYVTELFIRRIPPLGADAKALFLLELNALRESVGAERIAEDAGLTRIADVTVREYLADPMLAPADVQGRLTARLKESLTGPIDIISLFAVVDSIEEGAKQAAGDTRTDKAVRIGVGIAQGTRPGLVPGSIVLVLVFAR